MGLCISVSSSGTREENEYGNENAVLYIGEDVALEGSHRLVEGLGSACSKEGSKGLNQDAAILYHGYGNEDGDFYGVFDGHGKNGHMVSKMVRNRLPSLLLAKKNALGENSGTEFSRWREACVSAFKAMDKEIQLQGFDCSCSGTTAVLAIRQGGELIIANLGDSRAVLGTVNENGDIRALQLTTDLKPGVPSEAERIRRCNGRVFALMADPDIQRVWLPHEDAPGLAMSRAFGDFVLKEHGVIVLPLISRRRLTPNDQFLVLATDGVWDVLSNNEVASIVWGAKSKQAAAKAVAEAANAAWKHQIPTTKIDDITVVCLFLR